VNSVDWLSIFNRSWNSGNSLRFASFLNNLSWPIRHFVILWYYCWVYTQFRPSADSKLMWYNVIFNTITRRVFLIIYWIDQIYRGCQFYLTYPYGVFIPYTSLCLHHNFNILLIHVAIPKRHNDLVCRVMSIRVITKLPNSDQIYRGCQFYWLKKPDLHFDI
jgi:hypothetical protein